MISGCVNGSGLLRVEVTKECDDSTVARILEPVSYTHLERWWILYLGSCLYCREILWSIRAMESPLPLIMRRRTILLHAIDRK